MELRICKAKMPSVSEESLKRMVARDVAEYIYNNFDMFFTTTEGKPLETEIGKFPTYKYEINIVEVQDE